MVTILKPFGKTGKICSLLEGLIEIFVGLGTAKSCGETMKRLATDPGVAEVASADDLRASWFWVDSCNGKSSSDEDVAFVKIWMILAMQMFFLASFIVFSFSPTNWPNVKSASRIDDGVWFFTTLQASWNTPQWSSDNFLFLAFKMFLLLVLENFCWGWSERK